jgi:hypothetical protein
MGALLVGLEKTVNILARCHIYEALYRTDADGTQIGEARANLERSLSGVSAIILQFLATALTLLDKSPTTRALHAVFSLEEIQSFAKECDARVGPLEADASNRERVWQHAAHINTASRLQALLHELRSPMVRVDARVAALFTRSAMAEQGSILRWVSPVPYVTNHNAAREGRTPGTAEWISEHPTYREWRASSASMFLWLYGIRKSSSPLENGTHFENQLSFLSPVTACSRPPMPPPTLPSC